MTRKSDTFLGFFNQLVLYGSTALAVDPTGIPVDVVFLLPDRKTNFGLINDVTARLKCFIPVCSSDRDPDRTFADLKEARAMYANRLQVRKHLTRFGDYFLAFRDGRRNTTSTGIPVWLHAR